MSNKGEKNMKRLVVIFMCLTLCLAITTSSLASEKNTITCYYCIDESSDGWKSFAANHPGVRRVRSEADYTNTQALAGAFLTGEFDSDIFSMSNVFFDYKRIMEKGYCADLTNSETIAAAVGKMHPSIQEQVTVNGKIYALPNQVTFEYWKVVPETWDLMGLSFDAIPDTLPELFDWIDAWCDRIEMIPEPEVNVWNAWDATVYNEASYTQLFTRWVTDAYVLQLQYAHADLFFDPSILVPLLSRASSLGERLYRLESHSVESTSLGKSLFESISMPVFPEVTDQVLFMRMDESQPKLMMAQLSMYAINADSSNEDLCISLLESMAEHMPLADSAFLFQDAEPVLDPNYESSYARFVDLVNQTEAKLAATDLLPDVRAELEQRLTNYRTTVNKYERGEISRYLIPESQLSTYKEHADLLYFSFPSVFSAGTPDYATMLRLEGQYANHVISAESFVNELNRIAMMIQYENQ